MIFISSIHKTSFLILNQFFKKSHKHFLPCMQKYDKFIFPQSSRLPQSPKYFDLRQKCNGFFLPYVGPHFLGFEVIWFFIIIALSRLIATFLFCLIFYYNKNQLCKDIFYYIHSKNFLESSQKKNSMYCHQKFVRATTFLKIDHALILSNAYFK